MCNEGSSQHPATLSVEEAAQLLGISRSLAYEAARDGALPVIRVGRRLLVPRRQLLKMLGLIETGGTDVQKDS